MVHRDGFNTDFNTARAVDTQSQIYFKLAATYLNAKCEEDNVLHDIAQLTEPQVNSYSNYFVEGF